MRLQSMTPKQSHRRCMSRTWHGRQVRPKLSAPACLLIVMRDRGHTSQYGKTHQDAGLWMLQMMPRSDAILTKQHQQLAAYVAQQRCALGT